MFDFLKISVKTVKKGVKEVCPDFFILKPNGDPITDLMIRGSDFYAVWNENTKLWSTKERTALYLIDKEIDEYVKNNPQIFDDEQVIVKHVRESSSGLIDKWHKFVKTQMRDEYHNLDEKVIFSNTETTKEDYASKRLPYPLEDIETPAYDELISTLYSEAERKKIEWAIGSIIAGDSKTIQKFIVMYGAAGTGKSTILNIIQDMFTTSFKEPEHVKKDGYWEVFDAKALGSSTSDFALEAFHSNPLIAIQHDGDLSKIEDNTKLNSLVSHETMTVNEKYLKQYATRFNAFLFMGTNRPVRITDAKSGILRRLIDVTPTGNKLPRSKYNQLMAKIKFELGGIASHCLKVYEENKTAYDTYIPVSMLGASNDFYNFIVDSYDDFKREKNTSLKVAWERYQNYCKNANVPYPMTQRLFREELKNYFADFKERSPMLEDGTRIRNYYVEFIFDQKFRSETENDEIKPIFELSCEKSIFDQVFANQPAQLANSDEKPILKWADVTTTLKDISTDQVHYVKVPENHIVIDFDLKDKDGNKSFILNAEAASKWPSTYAELSKSGQGIHLHYNYDGDVKQLSRLYSKDIEVKVFTGNSSLRRRLSKCNNIPIATISSGLPLKEEKKVVDFEGFKNEKAIRTFIKNNLLKKYHPSTKSSIDYIFTGLENVYKSGMSYDVRDMKQDVMAFAVASTHQSKYCLQKVSEMHFNSDDISVNREDYELDKLVFFDVEVFINLFVVVYKVQGKNPVKLINPGPLEIEPLLKYKLVGFNNRRYDNHILYARYMGYDNKQLYELSQRIINGKSNAFFGEAYNWSYLDLYDVSSVKQSLKKFEIELGEPHKELELKWDEPVPEELWGTVADYCVNDVLATEAVFNARQEDYRCRQMLAAISGLTVNDTTRMHTTKIIFGNEKHPELVYTDLSTIFPGYEFKDNHSSYRGEDPGEGGYVYAEPGMYTDVALLDIASMHPSSIIALNLFGEYTGRYKDLLDTRLYIKHGELDKAKALLNGALAPYLTDKSGADELAKALKLVINSVYGYTTATFDNPFKDPRNKDNIVAKRGALFMINLKHEVQDRGFTVAHIKTDSIKIPNATPEIIQFVMDYGKKYGYTFEHEATYDRMCLVNDAVYIAKYKDGKKTGQWTATGAQFQQPYLFKTLFSKEPIEFDDMCDTKSVSTSLYLDMNEDLADDEHAYHFIGKVGKFCPIKPGCGGGQLMREKDGKYYAATGTKGYRWMESDMVKELHKEGDIDETYFRAQIDDAVKDISKYGDFEWFTS